MKLFTTVLFAAACAPVTLFAHESPKDISTTTAPKFVIGANLGIAQSYEYYYGLTKTRPTAGLFARYYLGNHLALETGIKFSSLGPRTIQSPIFEGHQYDFEVGIHTAPICNTIF